MPDLDLDRLADAVVGFTAKGEPDERNRDLNVLLDAARSLLTAETVWWCATHNAESTNQLDPPEDQTSCWLYLDFPEKPDGPCRMVLAVLTRRDTEPFVNQQGLW